MAMVTPIVVDPTISLDSKGHGRTMRSEDLSRRDLDAPANASVGERWGRAPPPSASANLRSVARGESGASAEPHLVRIPWASLATILVALAMAFFPPPALWVERWYSDGAYPVIDSTVRLVVDLVPFALGDVLLIVLVAVLAFWWIDPIVALLDGRRRRRFGTAFLRTFTLLAVVYFWFFVSWGLNYDRLPVEQKIVIHRKNTDAAAVDRLADHTLRMLQANVGAAHAEIKTLVDPDPRSMALARRLQPSWKAVIDRLEKNHRIEAVPVKPTLFSFDMKVSGTTGFTDPWTHEINLRPGLFAYERPAIYAHEWSHIAGFADESEANYIAVLACTTSSDPLLRYSGWLLVWEYLPKNIHTRVRVSSQVIDDIKAIIERDRREQQETVAKVQHAAYDRYLQSNHVAAGYADYGLFVRLLTAGTYDASGLPVIRNASR